MNRQLNRKCDLAIIGGGPAGLAAAVQAHDAGVKDILLLERDKYLGGILQQCIHNGFGVDYFDEELTGPEYAERFIEEVRNREINVQLETMVIDIDENKKITALNETRGVTFIEAETIILAMGCRERTRESIKIPGHRPAGVLTAGTAQRYINIEGYLPGKEVVILGSGDVGLIMARRMTLEGANVKAVLELMPYSSGLIRNKVQCLDDFGIPLKYQHTINYIHGQERVKAVDVVRVNDDYEVIPGSKETISCDTLLLSVGLIPENELSKEMGLEVLADTGGVKVNEKRETNIPGVFACGNVLQVHDLVDYVSEEAEIAGEAAARYLQGNLQKRQKSISLNAGSGVNYVVPHELSYRPQEEDKVKIFFRVTEPKENVNLNIYDKTNKIANYSRKIVTPGEMESVTLPYQLIEDNTKNLKFVVE